MVVQCIIASNIVVTSMYCDESVVIPFYLKQISESASCSGERFKMNTVNPYFNYANAPVLYHRIRGKKYEDGRRTGFSNYS